MFSHLVNFFFALNFVNILLNVLIFTKTINISNYAYIQISLNFLSDIGFTASSILMILFNSKTIRNEKYGGIIHELLERYKQANIIKQALRIRALIETEIIERSSPYYESMNEFRNAVRRNLMDRMCLSGTINVITLIFFYINIMTYSIIYKNVFKNLDFFYFILNLINPVLCVTFSYLVIKCDNYNNVYVYVTDVNEALVSNGKPEEILEKINTLRIEVERDLIFRLIDLGRSAR